MNRATRNGFVNVLLIMAILLVGLTSARADSLAISFSSSTNPNTGTPVNCPLMLPSATVLPQVASIASFFNCTFAIPNAGTFQVYGTISARNQGGGGAGFSSSLGINATVVALSPVSASVFVTVSGSQSYTIPAPVSTVLSVMRVDGTCNNPLNTPVPSVAALFFFVDGASNQITPPPSYPCPTITVVPPNPGGGPGNNANFITLSQAGSVLFLPVSPTGDAVTLEMQQVAFPPTGGPGIPFNPPPPPNPPVCAPGRQCNDLMNEFVPPPDPATGFVIAYVGDVRSLINIGSMQNDPTINPFSFQHPFESNATMSLDTAGNTEVLFSGPALTGTETYCYNGPSTCNNNPHFGVNAFASACPNQTCPTLMMLGQFWTNAPGNPFPGLSLAGPGLTGAGISYVTLFADVTSGGNTVGQWLEKPYSTDATPQLCFSNNTAQGETLSNVGFLVTPVAILQSMNYGKQTPPGQSGSPFTGLPSLNGRTLASGGSFCFTVPIKPDISVTNGDPSGQGTVTVLVNLNNTGGTDASNVRITSIKPVSPATYAGPVLPLLVGKITAGSTYSQSIPINVSGMASGSIAHFQVNGSYQDSSGNNYQFSSVRGVKVP